MNTELELLKQFFGGYFHEDWRLETQTPDEALTEYIAHSNENPVPFIWSKTATQMIAEVRGVR